VTHGTVRSPAELPPYPDGWFLIAQSDEVACGQVIERTFMGREVVVFRTDSGRAAVVDAYCPHLGAHLGKGGQVCGEAIRCPFHGFCFDVEGNCTSTGYGTKIPPRAKLGALHVIERAGFLLAYHAGDDLAPRWEPPQVDMRGWTPIKLRRWTFRGHPQETAENSVDIKHLEVVHGYESVRTIAPARTEGPYLTAKYAAKRAAWIPGMERGRETVFEVHVHGLGWSFVEADVPDLGLQTRQFVLPVPTTNGQLELTIAQSMKYVDHPGTIHPLLSLVPPKLFSDAVSHYAMYSFARDVKQDFDIWRHKQYVHPPALAEGDGPIGLYRKWCRQFYPELRGAERRATTVTRGGDGIVHLKSS